MPIIISRTGVPISTPELTEEQKSRMLDRMVAAFIEANPDTIRQKVAEYQRQQKVVKA